MSTVASSYHEFPTDLRPVRKTNDTATPDNLHLVRYFALIVKRILSVL